VVTGPLAKEAIVWPEYSTHCPTCGAPHHAAPCSLPARGAAPAPTTPTPSGGAGAPTAAALDDYAEYRRQGGRFDLDTWWARYKDDYTHSSES
jgi:hypothetical protein